MCVMFLAPRMHEDEMKKIMEERRREKEEEKQARLELSGLLLLFLEELGQHRYSLWQFCVACLSRSKNSFALALIHSPRFCQISRCSTDVICKC